jgi:hypothetical protein
MSDHCKSESDSKAKNQVDPMKLELQTGLRNEYPNEREERVRSEAAGLDTFYRRLIGYHVTSHAPYCQRVKGSTTSFWSCTSGTE